MIDWIKFSPIKLRSSGQNTEIKGPEFDTAKPITLVAAGNKINFLLPKHRSRRPAPSIYVKDIDGINTNFRTYTPGSVANDNWVYSTLLFRSWSYLKAWFGGQAGELFIDVSIVARAESKAFENFSFFHPKGFEFVISDYLNTRYGHRESKGEARYRAPINWKTHDHLPVFCVGFDVKGSNESRQFFFPISDIHFLKISFSYMGVGDQLRKKMEFLVEEIIKSTSVTLSTENKNKYNRINSETNNIGITKNFAPLKWPISVDNINNASAPVLPELKASH